MPKVTMDDGVKLNYRLDDFTPPWLKNEGKETVFMHHGFARNMKWWTLLVPTLSRKYRVLRIDARGCGESKIPQKDITWSADRPLKDVIGLLDYLGIEKMHWVGESSGGMLGIMFAVSYPERIKSLTLINTPLKFPDDMVRTYSQGYSDAATAIERLGFKEWRRRTMSYRVGRSAAGQQMLDWFRIEQVKTPTQVAAAFMRIFQSFDFSTRLAEVKVPILFLLGDRVPTIPQDYRSFMHQPIPNLKVVVFDDIGSDIQLVIPERCADELLRFLETVMR